MPDLTPATTSAVDNSMPVVTPAPAAPEPVNAAPTPTPEGTPAAQPQTPQFQPGDRSLEALNAILSMPEGADPATLFQAPAAATPPQETPPDTSAQPPAPEPQVAIPDKFKNPDGTPNVAAMAQSYAQLEQTLGRQGNQLGQMTQMQQELQQLRAQLQQPPAQPAQPAATPAPAPEVPKFPWEVEMTPEEQEAAQEEYFKDPLAAQTKRDQQTIKAMEHRMNDMLTKALTPLAPVVQQHQQQVEAQNYSNRLQEFATANPDIHDLIPEIQKIGGLLGPQALKAMEQAGQDPIKFVYDAAKSLKAPPAPPVPTVEQLITQPEYREKILSDPNIKNEILKSQISAVTGSAPPPMIGAQPGGVPPAAPAEHASNAKEAGRLAARFFGLRG